MLYDMLWNDMNIKNRMICYDIVCYGIRFQCYGMRFQSNGIRFICFSIECIVKETFELTVLQ